MAAVIVSVPLPDFARATVPLPLPTMPESAVFPEPAIVSVWRPAADEVMPPRAVRVLEESFVHDWLPAIATLTALPDAPTVKTPAPELIVMPPAPIVNVRVVDVELRIVVAPVLVTVMPPIDWFWSS